MNIRKLLIVFTKTGSLVLTTWPGLELHMLLKENARQIAIKAIKMEPRASVSTYTKFETYKDRSKHDLLCDRMLSAEIPL